MPSASAKILERRLSRGICGGELVDPREMFKGPADPKYIGAFAVCGFLDGCQKILPEGALIVERPVSEVQMRYVVRSKCVVSAIVLLAKELLMHVSVTLDLT